MIGMPRMTVISAIAGHDRTGDGDSRSSAHTKPSRVDSTSAQSVSSIVTTQPCSRIGRKSRASARNACKGKEKSGLLQAPLHQDLVDRTVGLQLGERGVDLLEEVLIGLAHADTDAPRHLRLVGRHELRLEARVLRQLVLQDRRIAEAGLDPAQGHVAQNVSERIVDLDLGEFAVLLQKIDVYGTDLRADDLPLEIGERLVRRVVV